MLHLLADTSTTVITRTVYVKDSWPWWYTLVWTILMAIFVVVCCAMWGYGISQRKKVKRAAWDVEWAEGRAARVQKRYDRLSAEWDDLFLVDEDECRHPDDRRHEGERFVRCMDCGYEFADKIDQLIADSVQSHLASLATDDDGTDADGLL